MKNWFGLEGHITDRFIHWSTKIKDRERLAKKYRDAYDKIVAAGLKDELEILLDAAWQSGNDDCEDSHSEDI